MCVDKVFDGSKHALAYQDLVRLSVRAEPRGEVGDWAARAIVVPPLEADPTERCVAGGDADPETELVAALTPQAGQFGEALA